MQKLSPNLTRMSEEMWTEKLLLRVFEFEIRIEFQLVEREHEVELIS